MTLRSISLLSATLLFLAPRALPAAESVALEPFAELREFLEAAQEDPSTIFSIVGAQRELGAAESLLLHAETLGMIWTTDFSGAARVADALEERVVADRELVEGGLFSSKSERSAIVHLLRARAAFDGGDAAIFEKEAKEAFWRDPFLGEIMAPWIEAHQNETVMKTLRFPLNHPITDSSGAVVTLADLLGDHEAVLLDFWATWCGPCIALMPELAAKEEKLGPQGVLVAGMNTENAEKAEAFRTENKIAMTWLVEPQDRPFSNLLGIDSIPRMVLVDREGVILFNGHPMDPSLDDALARVGAKL